MNPYNKESQRKLFREETTGASSSSSSSSGTKRKREQRGEESSSPIQNNTETSTVSESKEEKGGEQKNNPGPIQKKARITPLKWVGRQTSIQHILYSELVRRAQRNPSEEKILIAYQNIQFLGGGGARKSIRSDTEIELLAGAAILVDIFVIVEVMDGTRKFTQPETKEQYAEKVQNAINQINESLGNKNFDGVIKQLENLETAVLADKNFEYDESDYREYENDVMAYIEKTKKENPTRTRKQVDRLSPGDSGNKSKDKGKDKGKDKVTLPKAISNYTVKEELIESKGEEEEEEIESSLTATEKINTGEEELKRIVEFTNNKNYAYACVTCGSGTGEQVGIIYNRNKIEIGSAATLKRPLGVGGGTRCPVFFVCKRKRKNDEPLNFNLVAFHAPWSNKGARNTMLRNFLEMVRREVGGSKFRTIICGDFNTEDDKQLNLLLGTDQEVVVRGKGTNLGAEKEYDHLFAMDGGTIIDRGKFETHRTPHTAHYDGGTEVKFTDHHGLVAWIPINTSSTDSSSSSSSSQ